MLYTLFIFKANASASNYYAFLQKYFATVSNKGMVEGATIVVDLWGQNLCCLVDKKVGSVEFQACYKYFH